MKAKSAVVARPRRAARRVIGTLGLVLIYLLPILSIPGLGAIYLKIEGVDGESMVKGYEGWIKLDSFSWAVNRTISSPVGGGGRDVSPPKVSEISVSKVMDKSSPLLFLEAAAGKVFPKVEIHVTDSGPTGEKTLYSMSLGDVLVSTYASASGGDRPTEQVSFNFTKIEMKYNPTNPDGSTGEPIEAGYDFANPQPQ
jgi:type VI secretion system secreted protein Hcp